MNPQTTTAAAVERRFAQRVRAAFEQLPDARRTRQLGRFSSGNKRLPDASDKLRIGRYSHGIEQLEDAPSKRRIGRFSSGIERRPDAPGRLRRGSFAEGYAASSGLAPSERTIAAPEDSAVPPGGSSPWPHSRHEAEVEDIVHALRGYGVLTRAGLLDVCGAAHWSDAGFKRALAHAVSSGRIRQLGDELYAIAEPPIR